LLREQLNEIGPTIVAIAEQIAQEINSLAIKQMIPH
jgi:hypothetical protein